MTDDKPQDPDPVFLGLVASLQQAAMIEMGKLINPAAGKVQRRMEQAQHTIDLLGMLERKTKGNLVEAEASYLEHVLYELRMNFIEETNNPSSSAEATESGSARETKDGGDVSPESGTTEPEDAPVKNDNKTEAPASGSKAEPPPAS